MENNELQEKIIDCGRTLLRDGLVARTWGNVSARYDKNSFLITPSGRAYDQLECGDCVLVDINTKDAISQGKPSSEKGVHCAVYQARQNVNFIIHTHQYFASALSVLDESILDNLFYKSKYGENASIDIENNVKDVILAHPECDCFLMSNHGALILGDSYEDCYRKVMEYEIQCRDYYMQLLDDAMLAYQTPEELIDDPSLTEEYFPIIPVLDDMAQFGGTCIRRFPSEEDLMDDTDSISEDSMLGCIAYLDKQGFAYVANEDEEDDMNLIIAKHQAAWLLTTEYPYDAIPKDSIERDRSIYINSYSKLK